MEENKDKDKTSLSKKTRPLYLGNYRSTDEQKRMSEAIKKNESRGIAPLPNLYPGHHS